MATCPECDAEVEVDEFEIDLGDPLVCPECGQNLVVSGTNPVELDFALNENDETEEDLDDDLDDDDDDDDDEDDGDEDDDEDEGWEE
jgi:alpha-aminoadipate/glutamate carrier protein LysW